MPTCRTISRTRDRWRRGCLPSSPRACVAAELQGERPMPQTLLEKIWDAHEVTPGLLYIDLHLVHEVTSPQAFEALRLAGRQVRRPDLTIATMDHNVPTEPGPIRDLVAKAQLDALARNCADFGVPLNATGSGAEGIVHVMAPELGLVQPG